jgi:protein ImuB
MERTMCVWYPAWALQRPDASPDAPTQVVDASGIVVARSDPAARAGVEIGMRRRSAEAVCPNVVTLDQDTTMEMVRFEPVVEAIESLVPRVEVVSPGRALVGIAGAVRYYGGEAALVERVDEELALLAPGHRIGVALGPFAAYQAAMRTSTDDRIRIVEDDTGFLGSLDVSAVGSEDLVATFRWLGIRTLGQVAELPIDAVTARFGREGVEAHRLASGLHRSVDPRTIPGDPSVSMAFDPPIVDMERASFAARDLARRLIEGLAPHGVAPHRVVVRATAGDGTERSRTWRSVDPFSHRSLAERIRWQLRAWIDGVSAGIRGGLVSLALEPSELSGSGRQLALEEDAIGSEEVHRTLMEVQALAGADNVLVATEQGGRDPADRIQWGRWGEGFDTPSRSLDAPWPGRIPGSAPALVPPDPIPFSVRFVDGIPEQVRLRTRWEPVLSWSGPWRAVGRWWDGESSADRYQIVTSVGAYLCEVREGRTYLLGVYD